MTLPALPPWPLRYLIGANDTYEERHDEIVEYSYDAQAGETGYGTLTSEKERFHDLTTANKEGRYAPYLPATDITGDYGEWMPDPHHDGFHRNVLDQVERRKRQGFGRIELDNPDFDGLELRFVMEAHELAWANGLRTIGKNPLNVSNPTLYASHASIDMLIMERDDEGRGSDAMEELRQMIGQPLLAVRFVGYCAHGQDDHTWCVEVARNIAHKGYRNMGVTFSPSGEYNTFTDVQRPLP